VLEHTKIFKNKSFFETKKLLKRKISSKVFDKIGYKQN